jgi:5S rRNA maturation endonuclease (ribonuclease M5)
MTARQIIDETHTRHEQNYELEKQKMTLVDRSNNEEIREVKRYSRKGKDDNFKYLIAFLKPKGIKGAALLTWQHKEDGKNDDQWLYLPAYKNKLKRIAKGGKKNYFMGTDFTYEDMMSDSRDNYNYELLADETQNNQALYVIKSTPKDKKTLRSSGYSHRILKIRKDIFFVVATDFFDKRGKLLKQQSNQQLENISGNLWRANHSTMNNIKKKHKTIIDVTSRNFEEASVPKKSFTKRFITSKKHVR